MAAGLSREEELEARDQVERLYGLRASDIRIKAGQVLSNARKLQRASSDWYEWSMAQLLRSRGPDLVRMLLEPEHLDSRYEWERRLTIDALGRLGDTRTRGPQGADPVEALSQRLASVSLKWEIELAVLISQALGFLKDARAHRVLSQRRNTAGPNSVFWKRTAAAFARIPLPDSYFGSGRQAPRNASGYLARGQLQAARADFHGAVADYSKALERQPRSALALQLRALAHMALGQYDQALRDYNNADQLEPDNPTLLVNRGNTRQELHDLDGAIKDYTQAIKAQPRLGIAYYRRGLAWRMKKQHTKAVADYRRAMSEDSGLAASVYNSLGTVRLDLDNPKGAIEQFNLCLQIDPKNVQAFTNRGAARHALGDYYGAIQDYNLALRYNPVHAVAYKLRGDAYLARKAHRSALDDYDRALELTPNLEEAYIHRGIALTRLKQYDRAIRDLRHAAVKQPRQWKAWFGLAAALEGKGERKAARTALHKARRWAPESQHGQIQRALEKIED